MRELLIISTFIITNFLVGSLTAQELPTGEVENAQIIIEKDKPLTLPRASRLYKPITVLPIVSNNTSLSYDYTTVNLELAPFQSEVRAIPYKGEKVSNESANFLKVGFGNYISPVIKGYYGFNNKKSRLGLFLDHESFARGPVREEESAYARTSLLAFGEQEFDALIVSPSVSYRRESYYFYGFDAASQEANPNPLLLTDRVITNDFNVSVDLSSASESDWTWFLSPEIGVINMGASQSINQEFSFKTRGDINYRISESFVASIASSYQFLSYESGITQQRSVFNALPSINWENQKVNVKAGVNIALGTDSSVEENDALLSPVIVINWSALEALSVFGEISGGIEANSLSETQQLNRYLNDSLQFENQKVKINVKAGVSYAISDFLSISPYLSYTSIDNMQLFFGSSNDYSRFELVTESGSFQRVDLGTTVSFTKGKSMVSASLVYSSYQTEIQQTAWYLPTTDVSIDYYQGIGDFLTIRAGLRLMDGISGNKSILSDPTNLDTILNLNLGANYELNESFTVFAEVDNLFNTDYSYYLNYPVRGITARLGFIYRF